MAASETVAIITDTALPPVAELVMVGGGIAGVSALLAQALIKPA